MNIVEMKKADSKGKKFSLPQHGGPGYSVELHKGKGQIADVGKTEVELICNICGTHFLAIIATIEDASTIQVFPGHKAMVD